VGVDAFIAVGVKPLETWRLAAIDPGDRHIAHRKDFSRKW
jgi:hypothetical protein